MKYYSHIVWSYDNRIDSLEYREYVNFVELLKRLNNLSDIPKISNISVGEVKEIENGPPNKILNVRSFTDEEWDKEK